MEGRKIAAIIVGVLLMGVIGLCGLTAYGSYLWLQAHDGQVRFFELATEWTETSETRHYDLTAPLDLEIETDSGDITLIAEDRADVEVEIVKKAWGETVAEAEAAAAALRVEEQQAGNRLSLRYIQSEAITVAGTRGGPDQVSFTVHAPAEMAARLTSRQGKVQSTGVSGPLEIASTFGSAVLRSHTGAADIHCNYGILDIQGLDAGLEEVSITASFGDVQLSDLAGADFEIEAVNGRLSIQNLAASGEVFISNQFGDLDITDVQAGTLIVQDQNGKISIERGMVDGELNVSNQFGDITVIQVQAARYDLKTNNGDLSVDGAAGTLDLQNAFGDILVTQAEEAILTLDTENGNVNFSGELNESAEHTIQNSFGNITLAFPAGSAFDIHLKTEFGQIHSELPLTMSGDLSETDWQGAMNGGGHLLSATTNNGNISLLAIAIEDD
jgi:DUF4097 and DUF4098 domain-containing protein YvlB